MIFCILSCKKFQPCGSKKFHRKHAAIFCIMIVNVFKRKFQPCKEDIRFNKKNLIFRMEFLKVSWKSKFEENCYESLNINLISKSFTQYFRFRFKLMLFLVYPSKEGRLGWCLLVRRCASSVVPWLGVWVRQVFAISISRRFFWKLQLFDNPIHKLALVYTFFDTS